MNISARNKIKGKVVSVNKGVTSSEVEIETAGGERIAGLITAQSQQDLSIKEGDQLTAVIKATSVMFSKE